MKRKSLKKLALLLAIQFFICLSSNAQSKFGVYDVSVSINDVKHGMPFKMITPIHPGFELATTLKKKEKEKSFHSLSASLGSYYHKYLSNAYYLCGNYNYQRNIKNTIGIDLHPGLGFLYSIYPGDGYSFNESTKEYESTINGKANLVINLGFGLSYLKNEKFQPFIHYDINVHNVWAYMSFANSTAILKAGVKINL